MDEAVKYYRRTYKFIDDLIYTFRNGYVKKEIINFYKNCLLDYNDNQELYRKKCDGLLLTILIAELGINKESIENTNKFLEYNNLVVRKDHREELVDNNVKLNEFNNNIISTDFDNWLSIKNCPDIDKTNSDIIRRVRNSLLHGNYSIDFDDDYFTYTHLKTKSYYEATILNQNFYQFVGSYFSNYAGTGLSEYTNFNFSTYIGKINNEKNLKEYLKNTYIINFLYDLKNYNGKNSLEYLLVDVINNNENKQKLGDILKKINEKEINIKERNVLYIQEEVIEKIIKYFDIKYGKEFYKFDKEKQKFLISSYIDLIYNNKKHSSFWLVVCFYMINNSVNLEYLLDIVSSNAIKYDLDSIKPTLSILKAYLILYRLQYEGFEKVNYDNINFDYNDNDYCIWSEINNKKTDEDYFIESFNKLRNKKTDVSDKYIYNQILCDIIRNGLSHGNINILMNDNFEIYIEIKDIDKKRNKSRCIQMCLSKFNKFLNSEAFLPKNCISLDKDINNIKIRRR